MMETINHMASSAVKAVWGDEERDKEAHSESHREPISGVAGVVSRGEPYDAGNMDDETQRKVEREIAQREEEADQATAGTLEPHSTEVKSTPTPTPPPDPSAAAPIHQEDKDTSEGEGRPKQEPQGQGAEEQDKDKDKDKDKGKDKAKDEPKKESGSGEHEHREGGGEHYVKTTGLAADGGDFDATKPGAGREADRLLAEKGIQHAEEESAKASQAGSQHGKDKPSLGERIKHKLHKHS